MSRRHPRTNDAPWTREVRPITTEEVTWLCSAPGQAACREMEQHPADTPAAIAHWRERIEPHFVAVAWEQVLLRRIARAKFSRADDMLFDRVALEQATDEVVAQHKAARFGACGRVADLCCGIGGDAIALAAVASVTAVDRDAARLRLAEHNAGICGHTITGLIGDVAFDLPDADAAHIDPDRRSTGRRRHDADFASPGLDTLADIVRRYQHTAVKLSPGADFDNLPFDAEIELISHGGTCRQAVAWTGRFATTHRRATVLPSGESIDAKDDFLLEWPEPQPIQPGQFLLEPDPAVIRAHLVGPLARQHDLAPVDRRIAWLVGTEPPDTTLVHTFLVVDVTDYTARSVQAWLADYDIGSVDIKTRGVAMQPDDLARRLKLTGERHATLLVTRLGDRPVAILAERLPGPP